MFLALWGNWLRGWLHGMAREKVRQGVTEAAQKHLDPGEAQQAGPCDVGVVFALGIEAGGLEDLLAERVAIQGYGFRASQGRLGEKKVAVVQSGPGAEAAARATEALLDGHRPDWVVSAGLAGGLSPEVKRHDVVMADHLVGPAGRRLALELRVDPDSLASLPGVHVGTLLSVDEVVRLPEEKHALHEKHGAMAVDLETFAAAEVCRRRHVRFLAVRVISDPVDETLPPDVQRLLDQPTTPARLGAALGSVWRRPSSVKDLWRLKENALVGSERLGKFLAAMIGQLG